MASYYIEELDGWAQIKMIEIPAGSFMMGLEELFAFPTHKVTVPSFYISETPVTIRQMISISNCISELGQTYDNSWCTSLQGRCHVDEPLTFVSWDQAKEICTFLSKSLNTNYGLPTEAEWEYACRARTTTDFSCGDTLTKDTAHIFSEYMSVTGVDSGRQPNGFGLYDMHGNVWEWCEDDWWTNYEGAPTDGSARIFDDKFKVTRGGCHKSKSERCRSSARTFLKRVQSNASTGFRIVSRPSSKRVNDNKQVETFGMIF